jgi:hypothetical protein
MGPALLSGRKNRCRKMAWTWRALVLGVAVVVLRAQEWSPSDRLLDIIRRLESADGLLVVGDQGRSLGAYQLSVGAWADVNRWRKARGLALLDYAESVWTESASRAYAADYLRILRHRLEKGLNRPPTSAELYAAYNLGAAGFARCRFDLARVNSLTAAKCRQIAAFMGEARTMAGEAKPPPAAPFLVASGL